MTSTTKVRCLIAATLLCSAVEAQQVPSQQRGLTADTAYQPGVVDNINLFNGGLTLSIPLGPTYPVSPRLSFSLIATYSSNGWDYDDRSCFVPGVGTENYEHGIEAPHTNVAFGWRVQLGKIVEDTPYTSAVQYLSPDGSQHGFYPELHPGTGSTGNVWYSNNSTYMRLRYRSAGSCTAAPGGSGDCYRLEFPDGTIHEFHDFGTGTENREWLLTRMTDSFGFDHWVKVDYSTANQWRIEDSHGREHTVFFTGGRVDKVHVARFGTTAKSEYDFTTTATTIGVRNLPFTPACEGGAPAQSTTVPLLTQLDLPDGSAYRMEYLDSWNPPDVLSGGIHRLRLSAGGEYKWTYGLINFKSQGTTLLGDFVGEAFGVTKKEMFTAFGNSATKIGEWNYDYATVLNPPVDPPQPGNPPPCFHSTTVTDPNGDYSVHYFDSAPSGFSRWQYGLPFRRCDATGASQAGAADFLSEEVFDAAGTKLRSVYLAYDSDGRDAGFQQEKNHRLRRRRTVFHDDDDRFRLVESSDFDGLGNYRKTVTSGDFAGPQSRTREVSYNPGSGTLLIDPEDSQLLPQNSFILPGVNAPWVLGTFTERTISEDGATATEQFCFQSSTGFLERKRMLAGDLPQTHDVIASFKQELVGGNGTGFIEAEKLYGGDSGAVSTSTDLCGLDLPAEPQSHVVHSYGFGVRRTSRFVEPDNSDETVLVTLDADIDQHTGLISASRDSAGVETNFVYDNMARLVRTEPSEGAWSNITYSFPSPTSAALPSFTFEDCPNGQASCGAPLTERRSQLDGLGRLFEESVFYPEGTGIGGSARRFKYDGMDRKIRESVWETVNQETKFEYDRFGRITKIQSVDTSLAPAIFTYRGERRIDRSEKVATRFPGDDEHYVCYREEHDSFGRVVKVNENRGSDGSGACQNQSSSGFITTYSYDQSDRLEHVCAMGGGSECVQERLFVYDNRQFLIAEQHPEVGPAGGGWINYSYDAHGNVLSKEIAGSDAFSLRYRYDAANRLIGVEDVVSASPLTTRPLKSFHFGRANDGSDRRMGKLVLAKRFNHVDIVSPLDQSGALAAVVSQAYKYEGLDGRVSERQTRFSLDRGHYAFTTAFEYHPLGHFSAIEYPVCLQEQCAGLDPSRRVEMNYSRGFLRQVQGFASDFEYQLGGMLKRLTHENGVVESIEASPRNLMRPDRIETSGVAAGNNWNSGTYLFDASGNIKAVGAQLYTYDRMSRLVAGEIEVNGSSRAQTISYDPSGNVTSLQTNGTLITTDVSPATNRLTGAQYDAGGNVLGFTLFGETFDFQYDPLNRMKHLRSNTDQARVFLYDSDDERTFTFDCPASDCDSQEARLEATIRSFDHKILRSYRQPFGQSWAWQADYVYRDDDLLAAVEDDGGVASRIHFHLDHLGTPRQITDEDAQEVALHSYYPFGEEATDSGQNNRPLRFAGHERDNNGSSLGGQLDYMHARFAAPVIGRFLSVDPIKSAKLRQPQSWNRYSYNASNPMNFLDPDGREVVFAQDKNYKRTQKKLRPKIVQALRRPSFRAVFLKVASQPDFTVTISTAKLNSQPKLAAMRRGNSLSSTAVEFAKGLPTFTQTFVTGKLTGATLKFDLLAMSIHPTDKSGVLTVAHEFHHMEAALDAQLTGVRANLAWKESLKGDLPGSSSGPANNFGVTVFNEASDITTEDAERILLQFIEPLP